MLTLADVIFPAFYLPYVAQFFSPLAAIAGLFAEAAFYRWWNNGATVGGRLMAFVILANVVSSLVGVFVASFLPTGFAEAFTTAGRGPWRGSEWYSYAMLAWVLAFLVSVVVEGAVLFALRRFVVIRRPIAAVLFANACSYLVLVLVLVLSAMSHR